MNTPQLFYPASTQEVDPQLISAIADNVDSTAAAPEIHPMELLLQEDSFGHLQEYEMGDTVEGEIVGIKDNDLLVDIGAKSEGIIPAKDLEKVDAAIRDTLLVGAKIYCQVVKPATSEGHALLSLSRALAEYDWKHAEELKESQDVFEGEVTGYNRGGVIVFVGKARGFVPASQLVSDEGSKEEDSDDRFASMVGRTLPLKVIEIDRSRNRLILSERQAQREKRRKDKEDLLNNLKIGDVRSGRISSIAGFGAFVDLGGADGLIHLSEMAWGRIQDPSEVVKVGDHVTVRVISVDKDRRRIGLSLRQLQPEPWAVVHDNYAIGQLVEAEITRITSFGAFARVDGIIEGLVHISELSENRINHPKEVVSERQKLTLRIIKIDPDKRRMGLSLKRVAEEGYAVFDWAPEEGEGMDEETSSMAMAMAAASESMSDEPDEE